MTITAYEQRLLYCMLYCMLCLTQAERLELLRRLGINIEIPELERK